MDPMTLREAAARTSRSITTLRRYIRSGRLHAEKRYGRFGPEYFVAEEDLSAAGLEPEPLTHPEELVPRSPARDELATSARLPPAPQHESVPVSLFRELQMKHEQLLVQYGMFRAGGIRVLELQAQLEAMQKRLKESDAEISRLRQQPSRPGDGSQRELRRARLELEGRALEIAALKEKVRGLEMVTRNSATTETIEKQFSEVMEQSRRIEELSSGEAAEPPPGWSAPLTRETPDH